MIIKKCRIINRPFKQKHIYQNLLFLVINLGFKGKTFSPKIEGFGKYAPSLKGRLIILHLFIVHSAECKSDNSPLVKFHFNPFDL